MEWGWLWAPQLLVPCRDVLLKGGTVAGPVLLSQTGYTSWTSTALPGSPGLFPEWCLWISSGCWE